MRIFKIISLTAVCLLLGVFIALQFRSVKINQVLAQYEKKNVNEIIDELLMEKNTNEQLKTIFRSFRKRLISTRPMRTETKNTWRISRRRY